MRTFKLSTKVGSYKNKEWENKGVFCEMWKLVMSDDWQQTFWSIYDPMNWKEIKFNAFEMKQKSKTETTGDPF